MHQSVTLACQNLFSGHPDPQTHAPYLKQSCLLHVPTLKRRAAMSASGTCPLSCQLGLDTRWYGVWESGWVTACSYRRGLLENRVGGTQGQPELGQGGGL